MQSLCARKAEEDSDDRRKCDEGNGVDLGEQLLPGENDDSQKDKRDDQPYGSQNPSQIPTVDFSLSRLIPAA